MQQQFCAAVQALGSPNTTPDQRKAAEQWLMQFQRSDEGWAVALELVSPSQPTEVQTLAAQSLKRKAWLSRSSGRDLLHHLQSDLLQLLSKDKNLPVQPLRQLVLALVGTMIPTLSNLNNVLNQLAQAVPTNTTLMVLETLAEEVSGLEPFGPGSSEERAQTVSDIKATLRSAACGPLSYLAHIASQHQAQQQQQGAAPAAENNLHALHKQILSCFQAWIRLGTLHDLPPQDSHSLVNLAVTHLEDIHSGVFPSAGEVLSEVMEHCPQEWLPALHDPCMRAAQRAKQAAEEGRPAAAEMLCKVVSAYAVLAINIFEPASSPESSTCRDALMALATLPHVAEAHGELGDPVSWSALGAWTQLAEYLMDIRVGSYEVFDDDEFFGGDGRADRQGGSSQDGGAQQQQQQGHSNGGVQSSGGGAGFVTAAELHKSQEQAAFSASPETKAIFEQLLCALLHNLVMWQQKAPGHKECYVDGFTPTFTATLNDCLACCCSVLGPQRFTDLLWMLMDRPDSDPAATHAAAAAMFAVAAAGSLRLTSEAAPLQGSGPLVVGCLQTLARCLCKAAAQRHTSSSPAAFLVPFCCAASSTGRMCIRALAHSNKDAAATFINQAFQKALDGLAHPDDELDLHTPAAFTIKQLMSGAYEAQVPVSKQLVQALASTLPSVSENDAAAEQALVVALGTALRCMEGGQEAQQAAMYDVLQALTGPLHSVLASTQKALSQGRPWQELQATVDQQAVGPLRRYSLLVQNVAPQQAEDIQGPGDAVPAQSNAEEAQRHGHRAHMNSHSFQWLAQTFLQQLWPLLSSILLAQECVSGEFLQPMCKCMAVLIKAQAEGLQEQLQPWLEALATILFRPKGRHASEPLCVALALYGTQQQNAGLAQHAVSAVLSAPRAAECQELSKADQDPDLAEALLKIASAYIKHTFPVAATGSVEQAEVAVAAVSRLCATCACANNRGVAHAALQCMSAVLDSARYTQQSDQRVLGAVTKQGALLTTGLIGSLVALSPLGRVVKVERLIIDLGAISQAAAQTQPSTDSSLSSWLASATSHFQLSAEEQSGIVTTWPGAVGDVLAAERAGPREQQVAARRLKKLLRDFAELHSRTQ